MMREFRRHELAYANIRTGGQRNHRDDPNRRDPGKLIMRTILRIILLALTVGTAHAQGSGGVTPPNLSGGGTINGKLSLLSTTLPALNVGPLTLTDPSAETLFNFISTQYNLLSGNNANDVLGLDVVLGVNPGTKSTIQSVHTTAAYFHATGNNTNALSGCTTNCPGNIYNVDGLLASSDNQGTGPMASASAMYVHSPATPPTGGSLDTWNGLYVQQCLPGTSSAACNSIQTESYMNAGFGTTTPQAVIHSRGGNYTGTATAQISGPILTILSKPTNAITTPCVVSGAGVTEGTTIVSPAAGTGLGPAYTVSASQTVAIETMTFTCSQVPLIVQNYNGDSTTIGFIASSGGNAINEYITGTYDGAYGFKMAFGVDAPSGATAMNIIRNGPSAQVSIGYGDTTPGTYGLDVNDKINSVTGYYSNGTAGMTCSGTPSSSFASTLGIVTHC